MKGLLGAVVESPQWYLMEDQGDYVETFKSYETAACRSTKRDVA